MSIKDNFQSPQLITIPNKFYLLMFNNFRTPFIKLNIIKEHSQIRLTCGAAKPKVAMSFIRFFHGRFATLIEAVPAIKKVKDIAKN